MLNRIANALRGRSFDRPDAEAPHAMEASRNGRRSRAIPRMAHVNAARDGAASARQRARALYFNNSWVQRGVESLIAGVVGQGLKPRPQHPDPTVREDAARLWAAWNEQADVEGALTFGGLQGQIVREVVIAGECFVRRRPGADTLAAPVQLQVLPSEQCDEGLHQDFEDGRRIRSGIEMDAEGRRLAYHLFEGVPGDSGFDLKRVRVPAGEVFHVYRAVAPGQIRGVSQLASVLQRATSLDAYEDAELERMKVASYFVGFVRKAEGDPFGDESDQGTDSDTGLAPMEPGLLQYLDDGEDVTFADPPDAGATDFKRHNLRAMAAGIGVPFEAMTGDLADVNYSSIRAGIVEFRRHAAIWQDLLRHQLCDPTWREFTRAAVMAGSLPVDQFQALQAVRWLPPRWEWVDPSKDAKAEAEHIASGLKSRSEAITERGRDPEEVDAEIAADQERAQRLGLSFASAPVQDKGTGDASE